MKELYEYQKEALKKLHSGSVLVGGVGTGKTITSLYWYLNEAEKYMEFPELYIITTAKKRDDEEWENEAKGLDINLIIDSWNKIKNYIDVKNAIFIFDEQRLVGSGSWVQSFYKISRNNKWILLSATPGDSFTDYIPLFVANGYYKNKSDFVAQHVIWDRYSRYPRVKGYINEGRLLSIQKKIIVTMVGEKHTEQIHKRILCEYNKEREQIVFKKRYDPYKNEPIQQASVACYILRRVVNEDKSRLSRVIDIIDEKRKVIIFYNFDYELYLLRGLFSCYEVNFAEWNGHKHEKVPDGEKWVYLVQYSAGCEGWNCITTDTMIFYSQNYSYKVMTQAAGRIDRTNTPYDKLYYYHLYSNSIIDRSIMSALNKKKNFNEKVLSKTFKNMEGERK